MKIKQYPLKYLFIILFIACLALQLWLDYSAVIGFEATKNFHFNRLMITSAITSLLVIGIWILLGYVVLNVLLFFCRIINPVFNINRYIFFSLWIVFCAILYLLIIPRPLFMEMIITG